MICLILFGLAKMGPHFLGWGGFKCFVFGCGVAPRVVVAWLVFLFAFYNLHLPLGMMTFDYYFLARVESTSGSVQWRWKTGH